MCNPFQSSKVFHFILITFIAIISFLAGYTTSASAEQADYMNDTAFIKDALNEIASLLETKYVLPEKASFYAEEFRNKFQEGVYDRHTDPKEFARQVTSDLISITKDKHIYFRLIESSDVGEEPVSSIHHPIRYNRLILAENQGFFKLEWLQEKIGYIDIRRFCYYPDIKDMVNAAIRFLSGSNAIIIDLREHQGGSGDYLSSYFLKYPTQLTGTYYREHDFTEEQWTSKEIGMEPLTDVPLFLLTSKRTFSAAEYFAYNMKLLKRAVIIGDSTKGGAHSVDLFNIKDKFEIYIPTARAINPITKSNWEGIGVIPDIVVPSEAALDTAIALARKAGAEYAGEKEAELKPAVDEMEIHLDRAEKLYRDGKRNEGGAALDSFFQIARRHDLVNEFFMDVLAYNYLSPEDEEILYAVLKKKIEFFPESPTAYESLAYAYFRNNKKELAINNYKKAAELNPDNRNALRMVERLQNN